MANFQQKIIVEKSDGKLSRGEVSNGELSSDELLDGELSHEVRWRTLSHDGGSGGGGDS